MSMLRIAAKPGDIRGSTGEYSDISGALTVCIAYSACADGLESVPYRRWVMHEVSLDANSSEKSLLIANCFILYSRPPHCQSETKMLARATFWLRSI